jgi:hypothetical protein
MFPPGLPGLALLALRASVALTLLSAHFNHWRGLSAWLEGAAMLLSVALCAGYLTPLAAMSALLLHALSWWHVGSVSAATVCVVVLDAVALALVGPGAYSVDSYRFGRRVVVLPPL